MSKKKKPLSEEQLENVAGGGGIDPNIINAVVQAVGPMIQKGGIPGMNLPNIGLPNMGAPAAAPTPAPTASPSGTSGITGVGSLMGDE